jgi:pantetheine-phosphate adenylyltransferase/8-oxo-dGTP diphosphatase
MRRCVYAGSFDPITNGHLWMIEQGARLFDELIVAVGVNPAKTSTFTVEERLESLREVARPFPAVRVERFEGQYLVHFARSVQAGYILRGIRSEGDYEFERTMRHINSDLDPGVIAVFLMPPREIAEISSSFLKGLIGPRGWEAVVKKYVPAAVHRKLLERFADVHKG